MSRWVEQYKIHPFHTSWNQFEQIIDTIDEKTITDANALIEIARIKKIIMFIDSYLKIVDPELIQINYLQEATSNLDTCISEINNFISNNVLGHLHNTNSYLDSCVVSIKQLSPVIPKINGRSISSMVDAYNHAIINGLEQVDFQAVQIASKSIEELKSKLIDDDDSIESQIDAMHEEANSKYQKINEFYNETLIDATGQESTKTAIEEAKKDILRDTKEASDKLTETSAKIEKLDEFYQEVFGEIDDITKKREGGHRKELIASIKDLAKYKELQSKKYDALFAKIESLLPGATSAGLASAFLTRKEVFAKPNQLWTATFITALLGMFAYSVATFQTITTLEGALVQILNHLPLYIPVVWLAIYASKRKSENKRLEEEYAHRESLANSFIGYKEQIEQLNKDDTEALKEFLNNILNEISKNPSETLDGKHGDSTPLKEVLDQLIEMKKLIGKDTK